MKLSSKQLKCQARGILTGRYGLPMMGFILAQLIVMTAHFPFQVFLQNNPNTFQLTVSLTASVIISLLAGILKCGLRFIHLSLSKGREALLFDIFRFFTMRPDQFILAELLFAIIQFVTALPALCFLAAARLFHTLFWYLAAAAACLVTAGFLTFWLLSYHLVSFLLIEDPDRNLIETFHESRNLMDGSKGRLLYLCLSFLGMILLSLFSLGIGFLWVVPYIRQTQAEFYLGIIAEKPAQSSRR